MDLPAKGQFSRLRFRQLEMVCAIAECGSLRSASERMHQCAPALSKGLREVERIVGDPLFERSPQGLVATKAGTNFIREARKVLNQIARLHETFGKDAERRPAELTIGSAASLAWCVLPRALRAFSEGAGRPRIRVAEGRIVPLAEQLRMGDLDAIVMLATPEVIEVLDDPTLVVDQVHREQNVVVAARAFPGLRRTVKWKSLREVPWILPPPSFLQRRIVQQAFLAAGELPPEPFIESINMPAALRFAEAGLGVTAVPRYAAQREIAEGRLRVVKPQAELAAVPIGFAYRRSATNLDLLLLLRDAVRECMREPAASGKAPPNLAPPRPAH